MGNRLQETPTQANSPQTPYSRPEWCSFWRHRSPQVTVNGKTIQAVQSQFLKPQLLNYLFLRCCIPFGAPTGDRERKRKQSRRCRPSFLNSKFLTTVFRSASPLSDGLSRRCSPSFLNSVLSSAVFLSAPPQVTVTGKTI